MAVTRSIRSMLVGLTALAAACGGGTTEPAVRTPTSIALAGGGNQMGPAGATLPVAVAFRVGDSRGPMAGVRVRFTVEQGGGLVTPTVAETNADGVASATWRVGTTAGELSVLRGSVDGTSLSASATAEVLPGTASALAVAEGGGQYAPVGQVLPLAPAVLVSDQYNNPVPGGSVTFSVVEGNGTLAGAQAVADGQGIARAGQWTLGPAGGINTVRATLSSGATVDIQAIGTAVALRLVSGDGQAAHVGRAVGAPLVVRAVNAAEEPVAGISVAFSVTQGGGQITAGGGMTGPDGLATLTGWTLGLTPGPNAIEATSLGTSPLTFTATGILPLPVTIEQSPLPPDPVFVGNYVAGPLEIRVLDDQGGPILGQAVTWSVSAGGGAIIGQPAALTDADGRASAPGWRLGPGAGIQTLQASVPGLPPAAFTVAATPPPASAFDIEIRYQGEVPLLEYQQAVDSAATVWTRVLLGDLSDVPVNSGGIGSLCGAVNETVDDVIMFVRIEQIDGEFGTLGSAGPCIWRSSNSLPLVGGMRLDVADVARLHAQNQLVDVVIHEMGHILGFGTRWSSLNLLVGANSADVHFTGPAARTVFEALRESGLGYTGPTVPVENVGGAGSINSHWRESVLNNELLTSRLNSGENPLTALSLAGFRDMGYLVDDAGGEPFTIPGFLAAPPPGTPRRATTRFADVVANVGIVVDALGRVVARIGLP